MDQIQIINLGLGHISQRSIEDLNESSVQAEEASKVYDSCLQECLRGNNWAFAAVIDALASVANYTPPSNWGYAYAYPANSMAMWRISNSYTDPANKKGEDFRVVYVPALKVKVILTNCIQAYGEYTYYLQDTTLYDAAFVNVLSFRLAAALAMPLNADQDMAINMTKIFQNQMSEAQRQNSYESNATNGQPAEMIINARTNGGSNTNSVSIGGQTFDSFNQGQ